MLEAAQVPYVDVGQLPEAEGGGIAGIRSFLGSPEVRGAGIYAPPILTGDGLIIAQTPNICLFLAPRLGLVPPGEEAFYQAHQLNLTILDVVNEVHNTHHPLGVTLYYHEQQAESQRAAATFLRDRLPRFLRYFEGLLTHSGDWLLGDTFSYVDLSLFQLMRGLDYAFPHALNVLKPEIPLIQKVCKRVGDRPAIAAYLASDRCIPFNSHGVFRHYPELDPAPPTQTQKLMGY
jgi:glutathione S-transferase